MTSHRNLRCLPQRPAAKKVSTEHPPVSASSWISTTKSPTRWRPGRRDDAELSEVTARRIDQHCPLPDEEIPHPVVQQGGLLLLKLHRHKAHARTAGCLADRRRVRGIDLAPTRIGFDVGEWDELHLVPERPDLACPVLRGRIGPPCPPGKAAGLRRTRPPALVAACGGPSADPPHPVHGLEDALPEVEADGADLHDERLLSSGVTSDDQIRPLDAAQQGPSTPSTPSPTPLPGTRPLWGWRHGIASSLVRAISRQETRVSS